MESLKHECGVALIRLLKPLTFYEEKYGTWMYGLNKLYLLMEKQHNRGQEAAGLACVKLKANPGEEYMFRERGLGAGAITEIFSNVHEHFKDLSAGQMHDAVYAEQCLPFAGELYMGHLRYSTTGKSGISYVHPFLRRNNWRAKNLALCGNFNLTNVDEIFADITAHGQHPRKYADTYIMVIVLVLMIEACIGVMMYRPASFLPTFYAIMVPIMTIVINYKFLNSDLSLYIIAVLGGFIVWKNNEIKEYMINH